MLTLTEKVGEDSARNLKFSAMVQANIQSQ